ncbi:syntaphilin-like isoform X1 [Sinocyclocheilus grahami]|uniref:syntaphilin-like isoform X1 n=1 Tax=Sinocyclocheilus grahami TaxID=75366 RepID=UPI0007AC95A1|nr:PREDICTED: syntaphilin-like isoform X1 [Sinocyclocheilus grahami]XP_016098805.1 PREDICTED: syntaphilin-like isoform X1 [Sinocyclocheilus grahami]
MSSPSNKRSGSGSRKFNLLKALQPKHRLQQMLSSPNASPVFDYCRFIELDYTPMESGIMVSMRQSRGFLTPKSPEHHCRQSPAPVSNRDPYGNASLSSSSNSGSCKGSDGSPTHRHHIKYTSCNDNHGIRPPPPEQYLTPLQQKEVCIRHLRARLKETIERLQDRDTEIDELRTQLSRMQEDWIEEECHRVEAQLALKEARGEIQQLKQVVDVVRFSLGDTDTGVQKCFQDINLQNHKLESLLQSMELAQIGPTKTGETLAGGGVVGAGLEVSEGLVGSSEGSPARSLTCSSTYTKLSDQTGQECGGNENGCDIPCLSGEGTQDSGFVCCGDSGRGANKADLLLEAAFLSQETASLLNAYSRLPHSSTYDALCNSEPRVVPLRCSGIGTGTTVSVSHPCLSHHHLYLHHLREQGIQTDYDHAPASAPAHGPSTSFNSDLDTIAERTFRSQACSPTSTWMSDEEDDLESVATESAITATVATTSVITDFSTESAPAVAIEPLASAASVSKGPATLALIPMESSVKETTVSEPLTVLPITTTALTAETIGSQVTNSVQPQPVTDPLPNPGTSPCSVQPLVETELEPLPQTTQPRSGQTEAGVEGDHVINIVADDEDEDDESAMNTESKSSGCGLPAKNYWSRHFLVDLLAVVVPVVPTVAWLCRGPHRVGQPIYHIGSLLRGCCTVALHSLRRGGGLRHYPTGGGGPGGMSI